MNEGGMSIMPPFLLSRVHIECGSSNEEAAMFKPGQKYLEIINTGKLVFDAEGKPLITETQRHDIYTFSDGLVEAIKEKQESLSASELKPNCKYLRVFLVPSIKFDNNGDIRLTSQETIEFFEYTAHVHYALLNSFDSEKID